MILSWLGKQKGWLYPIVLYKFFRQLFKFIGAVQTLKFTQIIKYIYITMGAFNATLALIVLSQIFGVYIPETIREFLIASLKLFVPVIILDGLSDLIEYQLNVFKDLIKRLIIWSADNTPSPIEGDKSDIKIDKTPSSAENHTGRDKVDGVHVEDINIPSNTPKSSVITPDSVDFNIQERKLGDPLYRGRISDAINTKDQGDLYYGEYEDNSINWGVVFVVTALALGVSYYMFPDFYHNIYYGIKDKFFPRDSGGGGNTGGVSSLSASIPGESPEVYIGKTVRNIINDDNLTNAQKLSRIESLEKLTISPQHGLTPGEIVTRESIFANAKTVLERQNTLVEDIRQAILKPENPEITDSLTPTASPTGSLTPTEASTPINTGSLTPVAGASVQITSSTIIQDSDIIYPHHNPGDIILTNVSNPTTPITPLGSPAGSLTPTPNTPYPSNEGLLVPVAPVLDSVVQSSIDKGFIFNLLTEIATNPDTTPCLWQQKHTEFFDLFQQVLAPGNNNSSQDILDFSNMFVKANKFIDLPKATPQLSLTMPTMSTVKSDHSPILDSVPDNIDWAKDGKLRGIFTSKPPVLNLPLDLGDIPVGHLSNLPKESSTPVDLTDSKTK